MKSKMNLTLIAFLTFSALTITSCKKESSQSPIVGDTESITLSEENTSADASYDDIAEMGLSAGTDLESSGNLSSEIAGGAAGSGVGIRPEFFEELKYKVGPCTVINVSSTDTLFPKTVTVNYGEGCICRDGKFRKGTIVMEFSAPIRKPGAVLTISLQDYYVNRAHIEGTKTIHNLTENGNRKYATTVVNGKVTLPSGRGFSYEASKVVTQTAGMDTRTLRDDVYTLEGSNKTTYNNGIVVVKSTETPLVKPVACDWIVKGILKLTINARVLYIDFGNGDCDNKAILKWANGEKEITLP